MSREEAEREGRQPVRSVALPAPTAWPLVCGFGVCLGFAGLLTHVAFSWAGIALLAVGAAGWWRDVLPAERVERVAVEEGQAAPSPRPSAAAPAPGEDRHRMRIPAHSPHWSAGLRGGAIGGVAMAAVATAYGIASQGSPWYPVNLLAAVASPELAKQDAAALRAFSAVGLALGVLVHGAISLLVGMLYAVLVPMLPNASLVWGGVVAPVLWSGGIWACLGLIDPTLAARIEWPAFVGSQVAYGVAAGWVVARSEPVRALQSESLAVRAGVEVGRSPSKEDPS